jgi:hypothetical protein
VAQTADRCDGGTDVDAVHDGVLPGLSPANNETGWRMSIAKLTQPLLKQAAPEAIRPALQAQIRDFRLPCEPIAR